MEVASDMPKILVSVNLVVFKESSEIIGKAVTSVIAQTHRPLELNILDNSPGEGGRDKLLQTIRKIIAASTLAVRFSYTASEENTGFAKAHNILIRKSKGDFIVFLNADARLHPRYIERALPIFANNERIAALQPKVYKV